MGRNRFVDPRTKRLELSDGDWIEVKERLTFGETEHMRAATIQKKFQLDELGAIDLRAIEISIEQARISKLAEWLADWSFCDSADKPVPLSRQAIEALDPETANEVNEAVDKHIEEVSKNATKTSSKA